MTTENIGQGKVETTAQAPATAPVTAPAKAQDPAASVAPPTAQAPAKAEAPAESDAVKGLHRVIRKQDNKIKLLEATVSALTTREKAREQGEEPEPIDKVTEKVQAVKVQSDGTDAYMELEDMVKRAGWDMKDPRLERVFEYGNRKDFDAALDLARAIITAAPAPASQSPRMYTEAEVKAEAERRVQEHIRSKIPKDMGGPSSPASDTSNWDPLAKISEGLRRKTKDRG